MYTSINVPRSRTVRVCACLELRATDLYMRASDVYMRGGPVTQGILGSQTDDTGTKLSLLGLWLTRGSSQLLGLLEPAVEGPLIKASPI